MWAPAQPVVTSNHYYCPLHDVYGVGSCWVEGCTAEVDRNKWALGWSGSHHHDLSKKHITMEGHQVPIGRELKRLV